MPSRSSPLQPQPCETAWRRGLLVLDDDPAVRRHVCAIADRTGWAAIAAASFADGETLLGGENFDCIVTDLTVDGAPVAGFLRTLAELFCTAPVLLTGTGNRAHRFAAADFAWGIGLNACYPIGKPIVAAGLSGRLARIDERLQRGISGCCFRDCHWRKALEAPDVVTA